MYNRFRHRHRTRQILRNVKHGHGGRYTESCFSYAYLSYNHSIFRLGLTSNALSTDVVCLYTHMFYITLLGPYPHVLCLYTYTCFKFTEAILPYPHVYPQRVPHSSGMFPALNKLAICIKSIVVLNEQDSRAPPYRTLQEKLYTKTYAKMAFESISKKMALLSICVIRIYARL